MNNYTPHYLLAEAARRCRSATHTPVFIDAPLTDAQVGAAIRLAELGILEFSDSVMQQLFVGRQSLALTETDPPVLTGIDPVTMAGDGGMRR